MLRRSALGAALALGACAAPAPLPHAFVRLLAETPEDQPARLTVAGDTVVAAAVATGPGSLPPAVRTTLSAVAPGGELVFQGREWGPRGTGFRIDKHYREGAVEHSRSALIAQDGAVLERAHTVPLADVPHAVLATALQAGPHVQQAWIVSGPRVEECWRCVVRDRLGHTHVVTVGLDGAHLGTVRRVTARLDG